MLQLLDSAHLPGTERKSPCHSTTAKESLTTFSGGYGEPPTMSGPRWYELFLFLFSFAFMASASLTQTQKQFLDKIDLVKKIDGKLSTNAQNWLQRLETSVTHTQEMDSIKAMLPV